MKVEGVLAFIVQLGRPPNNGHLRDSLDPLITQEVKLLAPAGASQVDEDAIVHNHCKRGPYRCSAEVNLRVEALLHSVPEIVPPLLFLLDQPGMYGLGILAQGILSNASDDETTLQ